MFLLDALYINDGGGRSLLDYLISELEKTDQKVFYVLDDRVRGRIQPIKKENSVCFLPYSFTKRKKFYKENQDRFTTVFCFGNLPPNIKLKAKVYTYFHQLLFLKVSGDLSFSKKMIYRLKMKILNSIKKHTDFWMVQTDLVQGSFSKKYKVSEDKILILPFYPEYPMVQKVERKKHTYLYVSNATPHKNHKNLIDAFCTFYDKEKKGELLLTVNEDYPETLNYIYEKKKSYPIKNIGFVDRNQLTKYYQESEYLIFPSLTESFGLGLVEAIEYGCKIIGADLPYTYAVCQPSIIFNPYEKESIVQALSLSLQDDIKISTSKVKNNIDEIIKLLVL